MNAAAHLDKLTEREKEVLRRWLEHRTAKEIALDLGISHHAVEKRLKMARIKLGAASSLEAARALAQAEAEAGAVVEAAGYGQAVPHPPDLHPTSKPRKSRQHQAIIFGGIAMVLASIIALVLVAAPQPDQKIALSEKAGAIELNPNIEPIFEMLDKDGSGYLESPESPFVELAFLADPAEGLSEENRKGVAGLGNGADPEHIAEFYSTADSDGDGRVSFREFYSWHQARLDQLGVEITSIIGVVPTPRS